MKISIMQPTYFPWAGYFNLISQADVFIFLDDVQFEKCSWQNRNRILLGGNPLWITVPSIRKDISQKINEIQIDDQKHWRRKHIKTIEQAYAKSLFRSEVVELVHLIDDENINLLSELNIRIIQIIAGKLDYLKMVKGFENKNYNNLTSRLDKLTNSETSERKKFLERIIQKLLEKGLDYAMNDFNL